jgi:hypothetical protein
MSASSSGHLHSVSAVNGLQDYNGAGLLASDLRVASLLLNHGRRAAIARLFGVSGDKATLVTIIGVGILARAAHDRATRSRGALTHPSLGDSMIGTAVLRESAHWITGDLYRETPAFGTLVAIGVLGTALRPILGASVRGVKAASHDTRAGFDDRYGHLIRARRARRDKTGKHSDISSQTGDASG